MVGYLQTWWPEEILHNLVFYTQRIQASGIIPVLFAELALLMPEKLPPDTSKLLLCPMPGVITGISVGEGEEVEAGQALATVEAMKMENILRAEKRGRVARVAAKPGDSLAVDEVILEFE